MKQFPLLGIAYLLNTLTDVLRQWAGWKYWTMIGQHFTRNFQCFINGERYRLIKMANDNQYHNSKIISVRLVIILVLGNGVCGMPAVRVTSRASLFFLLFL